MSTVGTIEHGKRYIIRNVVTNLVIDLSLSDSKFRVQGWEYKNGDNQKWLVQHIADRNGWMIRYLADHCVCNLALELLRTIGDAVRFFTDTPKFLWEIRRANRPLDSNYFQIVDPDSSMALSINEGTTAIQIQPVSDEVDRQLWTFTKV